MQIESFMLVFIFRDKKWFHGILAATKKIQSFKWDGCFI
jgi:hypothetical protein